MVVMRSGLTLRVALVLVATIVGCSSPTSQASREWIRDPLGIDRAINDYYFPNKAIATEEGEIPNHEANAAYLDYTEHGS